MPLGLKISSLAKRTFLNFVSRLATSIVNFLESVQKMLRADQSTDRPSAALTPERLINVSYLYLKTLTTIIQ